MVIIIILSPFSVWWRHYWGVHWSVPIHTIDQLRQNIFFQNIFARQIVHQCQIAEKVQQEKWHNRKHFSSSPKKLNGISDDVAHLSYICHKASAQISATVNSQEPQIWEKLAHIAIDHLNTSLSSHKSTCIFIISIKISWSSPSFSLNPSKIYTAASVKHSWCINFKLLSRSNFGQKSLVIL